MPAVHELAQSALHGFFVAFRTCCIACCCLTARPPDQIIKAVIHNAYVHGTRPSGVTRRIIFIFTFIF